MKIIREFRKPLSNRIVLNIPETYVKKNLEILIIPPPEENSSKIGKKEKAKLFEKLCGMWEDRPDISREELRNRDHEEMELIQLSRMS
ncbi:MAG: hypothetical protein GY757_54895 [bacterium]|nr:hypothetical protein [bacterium]